MDFERILPSGETMYVTLRYQDSDGEPNLYIRIDAANASGKHLNPKKWDGKMLAVYKEVLSKFEEAGFYRAQFETQMGRVVGGEVVLPEAGMQHDRYKDENSLMHAGAGVMARAGFEVPPKSVEIPTGGDAKKKGGYAEREKKGAAKPGPEPKRKEIDFTKMRNDFEDAIAESYPGNDAKAIKLSDELVKIAKKHAGHTGQQKGPQE